MKIFEKRNDRNLFSSEKLFKDTVVASKKSKYIKQRYYIARKYLLLLNNLSKVHGYHFVFMNASLPSEKGSPMDMFMKASFIITTQSDTDIWISFDVGQLGFGWLCDYKMIIPSIKKEDVAILMCLWVRCFFVSQNIIPDDYSVNNIIGELLCVVDNHDNSFRYSFGFSYNFISSYVDGQYFFEAINLR